MTSSNLVQVQFGPRAPDDLPAILREMADAAERGEITGMVMASIRSGSYEISMSASLQESLVLATLLHTRTIEKFRE
jgi:hypothetical protein